MANASLTGKDRLLGNVVVSWFSQAVFVVAGFVLPHQIDHHLGPGSLGIWDFGWSLVNYLSLSALGIGSALNRYVASYRASEDYDKLAQSTSTVAGVQAFLAVLVLIIALVLSYFVTDIASIPAEYAEDAAGVVFFLGLSLSFQFWFDTSRGVLTGCHRWDIFNALHAGCYFLAIVGMLLTLLLEGSIVHLAMIYATMQFVQGLVRTIIAGRICPEAKFGFSRFSKSALIDLTSFGVKSIALAATTMITYQTTNILLIQALGPVALAIFARPLALVRQVETLLNRFTFMLTPMAGSIEVLEGKEHVADFVLSSVRTAYAVALPVLLTLAIFGDLFILVWMGEDYVNVEVISILALGLVLPLAQSAIVRVLIGVDKHGRAAVWSLLTLVVVYPVLWFFLRPGNVVDFAVLAVVPIIIVNGLVVPAFGLKEFRIPVGKYLHRSFSLVSLGVGAAAVISLAVRYLPDDTLVSQMAAFSVFWLLVSLFYWFVVIEAKMKNDIRQFVAKRLGGAQ